MGGSSKKVTVGYKYYIGMHMVLCHGPVDSLTKIIVDGREAWAGSVAQGPLTISKANLFGGESREGGISGTVDVLSGAPDQGVNSYLQSKIGGLVPSFRGVTSVVLRQVYVGLNPYLKKWSFRVKRILVRQNGLPQWYPGLALINASSSGIPSGIPSDSNLYIALDTSGSMAGTKIAVLKTAMGIVFDELQALTANGISLNIKIQAWASAASSITRAPASVGDFSDLRSFVNGLTTGGGTDANAAYSGVVGFFSPTVPRNNICVCVSDGDMSNVSSALSLYVGDMVDDENPPYSVAQGTAVKMRGVGIETAGSLASFDNSDGPIPVVSGSNPEELAQVILAALISNVPTGDMNPAHIIRECLTDPDWGMGYAESDIDDVSFMACADKLYFENMGISILWDRQTTIEDFIKEIVKHIDAALYVDRFTGKFKLKLIRFDYDENTLVELDESNIDKVTDFSRPAFGELTNSVSVNYWDSETNTDASVTLQDIALAQMQGVTINTTVQYPGFTNKFTATNIAQRDLKTLSTPLITCTIYANTDAASLNIGDVFKFTWPDYEVFGVVMRVTGIAYGDGKNNRVRINATQDVFNLPDSVIIEPPPSEWVDPNEAPVAVANRIVFEVPYLELVQQNGQTATDGELSANPEVGYVGAAALRPQSNAINARLMTNDGGGFEDAGALDFCPGAFLDQEISFLDSTFSIKNVLETENVKLGSWCQIGSEIMAVIALTADEITVKRGCLDTVPAEHAEDAAIYFWDAYAQDSPTEYVQSDTIDVRLLTGTGGGELLLEYAPNDSLTIVGRAARPYPPGQVRINGQYYPTAQLVAISLTWVHRNRVQQTGANLLGFEDDGVTPEDGTTYKVELLYATFVPFFAETGITGTSFNVPSEQIPLEGDFIYVRLSSVRDGLDCFQPHTIRVNLFRNTGDNIVFEMDETGTPPAGDAITFTM